MDRVDDERAHGSARLRTGLVAATGCLILAAAFLFAPPQSARVTRAAEPTPAPSNASDAAQPPGFSKTKSFSSERYGYSIHYPHRWTVEPSESDSSPDSLVSPNGPRLTIVRQARSADTTLARFVDATFPKRCPKAESAPRMYRIEPGPTAFAYAVIDGHPARVRGYCWRVDAVVDLDDAFLVMTFQGGSVGPRGGRWTFDWLAERIDIDANRRALEPKPSADLALGFLWTETFVSDRYGYSIRHPRGWIPGHAKEDGSSDEFYAPAPSKTRLSIVRGPKPDGMTLDEIALDVFSARSGPDGCHWDLSGMIIDIPTAPQPFDKARIAGRSALVRSECGFIDAVIDDAEDVLLVVLRSGTRNRATGDRWNFDRFMETLAFDPHTTAGPPDTTEEWKQFRSKHHGYAIRHPPNWIARQHDDGRADWFFELPYRGARLSIVRQPKLDGMSLREIADQVVPDRAEPDRCRWVQERNAQPFEQATIAGRQALQRSECNVVDAVLDDGEDFLVITLYPDRFRPVHERWGFDRFMETLVLDPNDD